MVEALIVIAFMIVALGGLMYLHAVCIAQLDAFQEARTRAWREAAAGCPSEAADLRSIVTAVASGEFPLPDSYLPSASAEGTASRSVGGLLSFGAKDISMTVRVPCQSAPAGSNDNPASWVLGLLGVNP